MGVTASYILDVSGLSFDEQNGKTTSWVHALPIGSYKHPIYGTISLSDERSKRFADGVKSRVRGIDLSINYVHDNNNVAAGWVKDAESRTDGLWLFVEWVQDAYNDIKNKKWRYFSSEFVDEWEDTHGTKHKDVLLGGALTNRPYMKNLVPINLSEATYEAAFDLVAIITNTDVDSLKGGKGMELSDEQLQKIIDGLATKLSEKKPPVEETPSVKLTDIPELKELAEQNPIVKLLIEQVEKQNRGIADSAKALKEAEIARKLAEFDHSKIVLTPTARELTEQIAVSLPEALSEQFWKLLTEMKRGSSFLVELGERAGATVNYGTPKSAEKQFHELSARLKTDFKLSDADAFERAAAENPALYKRYRGELNGVGA